MKKHLLLSCAIILLSIQFGKSQITNTNISNGIIFDGEPYLAINPTNNQNLVAAWMGIKLSGGLYRIAIKTRVTFDGGNTWSTATSLPHFGTGYGSADVSMAFDKNGLLYLCYIDYKQNPDSGGIYVARSFDGGLNWDSPSKAFDMYDDANKRPIDRPWMVVDNSNTANSGTLYITTKPAPWISPPNRNYYKVSTDSGHTWSAIANIDGGNHLIGNFITAPMAAPATTFNGNFCTVYPSYVTSQNILPAYYFSYSGNQGQTFSYATVYAAAPAAGDTNLKNGYQLIAHHSDSNKLIFISPDSQNGDADIIGIHSNDGGQTWSTPIRINDDVVSNGKAQDMVWGAYNEQGDLAITWRDRRNSGTNGFWNAAYDFYYATSSDNGQTFSSNQKLSSQLIAFDSIIAENGNDFMSCVFTNDTLCTVWGDTRSGKLNIYFAKTIVSTNTSIEVTLLNSEGYTIDLFPDPVGNELKISVSNELVGKEFSIYDSSGRKILNQKTSFKAFTLDTSSFSSGIYFLKIDSEIKRFVKN